MKTRRILAGVVGATMALTMVGAVFAAVPMPPPGTFLNQSGTTLDPADFLDTAEVCDALNLAPGEVSWHFVYTADGTGTLQARFAWSDGVQDDVDSEPQGSHQDWTITTGDVTLDGSATWTNGTGGNFNLSHTCIGETVETPTPTLPDTGTPTPTLPDTGTPTPTLPQTNTIGQTPSNGAGTSLTLVFALILAVAGGLVAYAMRPRRVGNR